MLNSDIVNSTAYRTKTRSDLEYYYAIEHTRMSRLLTITGISSFIFGLLILGAGIFFRMIYDPASFNIAGYSMSNLETYAVGLSGIVVGSLLAIGGLVMIVMNKRSEWL